MISLPSKGYLILYTNKHPYHADKAGQVFGKVIKTQGYIAVVERPDGEIDRLLFKSTDGLWNPFYEVSSIEK